MQKKHSFTLLEFLVSISLTAIIIALLLTFTFHFFTSQRKVKIAKQELLSQIDLQVRLRQLFSEMVFPKEHSFYLEPKTETLNFLFKAQPGPDPLFNGLLQGSLFVDKNNALILKSQSLPENPDQKPFRLEKLASNIDKIKFRFYQRKSSPHNPQKLCCLTVDQWTEKEPPEAMQIIIEKKQPETLIFFLDPNKSSILLFEEI